MSKQALVAKQLDAEFRAAEARMDALEADARARKALEEMEMIAGVRAHRDKARERLVDLKTQAAASLDTAKRSAEMAIQEFEVAVERVSERFSAWDDASNEHLNARLDEAEARLREWKAKAQAARTEQEIRGRDALAALEERIALVKARVAEWNQARHEGKAAEAARDAARHFDEAYDAAAKQYNGEEEVMVEQLIRNWGWVAVRGALAIGFGALTLFYPGITLVALVALFGAYAIVDGVVMIVSAIGNRRTQPRWGILVVGGILGIAAGVVTFFWPGITALALLAIIASWAIVMGIVEVTVAIRLRKEITGEWAMVLSGLLAMAFGVMLIANPGPGALAVVLWIGAYAVLSGVLLLVLAFRLRKWGSSHGLLESA